MDEIYTKIIFFLNIRGVPALYLFTGFLKKSIFGWLKKKLF